MQHPASMAPMMSSFPTANITTDQIQKFLDENKKLILAILENQNLGKLAECAQYQAVLQKNLMYLAAIADAQPQGLTMAPQVPQHPVMQQGRFYVQHPQAAAMAQQPTMFPQMMPLQFSQPRPMQDQQLHQLHQQQAIQGQMGVNHSGPHSSMHHRAHNEATVGGGSSGVPPAASDPTSDLRGGNAPESRPSGADAQGGGDGESSGAHS